MNARGILHAWLNNLVMWARQSLLGVLIYKMCMFLPHQVIVWIKQDNAPETFGNMSGTY